MKVLFDHNLSFRLARALDAVVGDQHDVKALIDKFKPDVTDIEWISALNSEGHWIVISGDRRITRNRAERSAFQSSRLTGFFMSPGLKKAPVLKQLERLCALWDNIIVLSTAAQPGGLYELPMKSSHPQPLRL